MSGTWDCLPKWNRRGAEVRPKRLGNEGGFILILILLMMLVLTIIGISAVNNATYEVSIAGNQRLSERAFYAADAGIQDGINRLSKKVISDAGSENSMTWNAGTVYSTPGFNNTFTVTHHVVGNPPAVAQTEKGKPFYLIRSTGTAGTAKKTLEGAVSFKPPSVFDGAMSARDKLTISGGGIVDSYNSTQGTYLSQATHTNAKGQKYANQNGFVSTVGTGGSDIEISGGTSVYGSASATGETVLKDGSSHIYGTTTNNATPSDPDPLGVTSLVNNADPSPGSAPPDYKGNPLTFSQSQSPLNFNKFDLSSKTLTLTGSGPVTLYVEGDFSMSGGSKLIMSPGINLTIYVKGNFTVSGGGIINQDHSPSTLSVYCSKSTGSVALSGDSDFFGTIYAPFMDVQISGGSDFYGAVRAKTITQSGGGSGFHYDESLGGGGSSGSSSINVSYWRQVFNQ